MIRLFDFIFSFFGLIALFPLLALIFIISLFDTGSPLFIQERVGKHKKPFNLVKFRTMRVGVASVASHLSDRSDITKFGNFLRISKIDELPQLYNVLMGHMSLVGPRPNLYNQSELIFERERIGVYDVRPGITGLSQIKKIDMSQPQLLAQTDALMIKKFTIRNYFSFIFKTILGSGKGDRIK